MSKNNYTDKAPPLGGGGGYPGEYILKNEPIECNVGRPTISIVVTNTGDRPVQVGSHYHFFEANKHLEMDREQAFGMRLNIAAGTAVRFEPGEEKEVTLVTFGGTRHIYGFNNLVNGDTKSAEVKAAAMEKLLAQNFKHKAQ
jgi:urease subunit beta